jgi:hypothetical protein
MGGRVPPLVSRFPASTTAERRCVTLQNLTLSIVQGARRCVYTVRAKQSPDAHTAVIVKEANGQLKISGAWE